MQSGRSASCGEYFAGQRRDFDLPAGPGLDWSRPPWRCCATLMTVGYGETVTYAELAARSGTGVPARAIGSIMAANPVPIVIPLPPGGGRRRSRRLLRRTTRAGARDQALAARERGDPAAAAVVRGDSYAAGEKVAEARRKVATRARDLCEDGVLKILRVSLTISDRTRRD